MVSGIALGVVSTWEAIRMTSDMPTAMTSETLLLATGWQQTSYWLVNDLRVRIVIKSDFYVHHGVAQAHVWSPAALQWGLIADRPPTAMHARQLSGEGTKARFMEAALRDQSALLRIVRWVLADSGPAGRPITAPGAAPNGPLEIHDRFQVLADFLRVLGLDVPAGKIERARTAILQDDVPATLEHLRAALELLGAHPDQHSIVAHDHNILTGAFG